jgi:hypothetical protein
MEEKHIQEIIALRELVEKLVKELNMYNQHDMLGGYLDGLTDYNEELEHLGLPTFEATGTDED